MCLGQKKPNGVDAGEEMVRGREGGIVKTAEQRAPTPMLMPVQVRMLRRRSGVGVVVGRRGKAAPPLLYLKQPDCDTGVPDMLLMVCP